MTMIMMMPMIEKIMKIMMSLVLGALYRSEKQRRKITSTMARERATVSYKNTCNRSPWHETRPNFTMCSFSTAQSVLLRVVLLRRLSPSSMAHRRTAHHSWSHLSFWFSKLANSDRDSCAMHMLHCPKCKSSLSEALSRRQGNVVRVCSSIHQSTHLAACIANNPTNY